MSRTFLVIIAIAFAYGIGFMALDALTGRHTVFNFTDAMLIACIIMWSKDRDERKKEQ